MTRLLRAVALAIVTWLSVGIAAHAAMTSQAPDPSREVLMLLRLPAQHLSPDTNYGDGYGGGPGRAANRRLALARAQAHGYTLVDDWAMPIVGLDCYILTIPDGQSPENAAALLSRDPGVEWAEPMKMYKTQGGGTGGPATYNDPLYATQPVAHTWRLSELHQIATGRHIRVAVIDSMIEADHPDLAGQVVLSQNFVTGQPDAPEIHGTGVAGIIAALGNNGQGIVGVAPQARLMALRACWQTPGGAQPATICDSLTLAEALDFAITNGAQVINMSLSGPRDPLLGKLLDVALARGITVVGAVDPASADGGFPASHSGVIAVDDAITASVIPDVFNAPGLDIPTTQPTGKWYLVSGSSYAAAHVSGLFALMRQRNPHARTATALVSDGATGGIDACATLIKAAGPCNCDCARSVH